MVMVKPVLNFDLVNAPEPRAKLQNFFENNEGMLLIGTVIDSFVYLNTYLIKSEQSLLVWATAATGSSQTPKAVKAHTMYSPGDRVAWYVPKGYPFGIIIGGIPPVENNMRFNVPDWFATLTKTSFQDNQTHRELLEYNNKVWNFNNSRPYDALPGDFGATSPLGVSLNVGLDMALLRASDAAGISMFYRDQLVRINALNFQMFTSGREDYCYNFGGENNELSRFTPYPWEMLGVTAFNEDAFIQSADIAYTSDKGDPTFKPGQVDSYYSLTHQDQTIIPRFTAYKGYEAGGERSVVSCPVNLTGVERYQNETNYEGLSEIYRGLNGQIDVLSTKGINLEKTIYIPVPKLLKPLDDATGNTEDDYKFAGVHGDAAEHDLTEFNDGTEDSGRGRIARLMDEMAWVHQKQKLQVYHRKDKHWHVPDGQDLIHQNALDPGPFKPNNQDFVAAIPVASSIKIDDRTGNEHKYYKGASRINMLDDGSIVFEDAWGSQIIMREGNIIMSPQNDIVMQPGRHTHIMSPGDVNIKGGTNVDITASKRDVRIKAEKNLHTLSGNSGTGGTLIESRGTGFTQNFNERYGTDVQSQGVIIMARNSQVAAYGQQLYMRSLNSGSIILDGDGGDGQINIWGRDLVKLVGGSEISAYGTNAENGDEPEAWSVMSGGGFTFRAPGAFVMDTSTIIAPNATAMAINGSITTRGSIQAGGSVVASSVSDGGAAIEPRPFERADAQIDTQGDVVGNIAAIASSAGFPYFNDESLGSSSLLESMGFSCRVDGDTNQYSLKNFKLYETRWQQLYKQFGVAAVKWDEPVVEAPDGTETRPFPGNQTWTTGGIKLYSNAYWRADNVQPGGLDPYEDDAPQPEEKAMATDYLINYQGN